MTDNKIEDYLNGIKLIGDDFSEDELIAWYLDESNAYEKMVNNRDKPYIYEYHGLNTVAGFNFLKKINLSSCLGFGAASGLEFLPIKEHIHKLTILDPGNFPDNSFFGDVSINYVKPNISGCIPLPSNEFDIITCFGALHHVANVTFVISELFRVLKPNGKLLVREPITNMGDWRTVRQGLTLRERGIPCKIMNDAVKLSGLKIDNFTFCDFSPLRVFLKKSNIEFPYNKIGVSYLDIFLSQVFKWNVRYNRPNLFRKFAPASGFWICSK
jgi:SAM-dependent methyltransferase